MRTFIKKGYRGPAELAAWLDRSRTLRSVFAAKIGISRPYMSQVLAGERRPSVDILQRIERETGIPIRTWTDTSASTLEPVRVD